MHGFEVHSNESACRKKVRLGLEQVLRDLITKHMDILTEEELHFLNSYKNKTRESNFNLLMKVHYTTLATTSIIDIKNILIGPYPILVDYYLHN